MAVNELITKRRHFDIDKVLHNYNIDKKSHEAEKTFIEVAKLIAQREPLLFLDNFEKFELTDQEILVDITKSMILTGSKDQASLLEIAKLFIEKEDGRFLYLIVNFGLKEEGLFEIVKPLAVTNPGMLLLYIKDFGFNEKNLTEIVEIIAEKSLSFCIGIH